MLVVLVVVVVGVEEIVNEEVEEEMTLEEGEVEEMAIAEVDEEGIGKGGGEEPLWMRMRKMSHPSDDSMD